MSLIKIRLLVDVNGVDEADRGMSELQLREKYKPEYIDGWLPKNEINEFHINRQFPYETIVSMKNGAVVCVGHEGSEFAKLYENTN